MLAAAQLIFALSYTVLSCSLIKLRFLYWLNLLSVFGSYVAHVCRLEGSKPYIIPVGGSNPLGCWGYIEAFREMMDQVSYNWNADPTYIMLVFIVYYFSTI